MNKEETKTKKQSVKKDVKKTPAKKPATKKAPVKKTASAVKKKEIKTEVTPVIDLANMNECRYCHNHYEKGMSICPTCRRSQKDKTGVIVISILAVILLLCIIGNHFFEKYYEEKISEEDYKYSCTLTAYEDLVRNPKNYKNKDIKVIGTVVDVTGTDFGYGNSMSVTIDANLFDGENEQLINFEYLDKEYDLGLLEGDIITIYGEYKYINGNTPFVNAKYIVFGT